MLGYTALLSSSSGLSIYSFKSVILRPFSIQVTTMHKIKPIDVIEAERKKTAPGTVLSVSYKIKRKMNRYLMANLSQIIEHHIDK